MPFTRQFIALFNSRRTTDSQEHLVHTFYITTPIYYVNANPHLGHAYTTIVADAVTRLHKMLGEKTLFLTGTDEHGDKIVQAAEKKNLSPKEFVDDISSQFRALWPRLSIANDRFTRTTDPKHIKVVRDILQKIYDAGDIYFDEFGGYYCYGCERFYTEKELDNGLCPQHLVAPEFIREKNYFFRMSRYLPWLKAYIEENPDLIRPERYRKEALAMLEAGVLEDLCISRPKSRLTWGIELPFDSNYVCYVWFDALVSYISDLGWPDSPEFRTFWPGEHLVAKDILKPHAIFWPCMLKAAGLPVYRHLDVHGYWLVRDTKMSKSLGNVVDPLATGEKFGLDAFRYFLLREMNFGADASFGEEAITSRINADLANDLGNLFSRVLSMNSKYFNCLVPEHASMGEDENRLVLACKESLQNYVQLFIHMEFAKALESLWIFVRSLNRYVDAQAPWTLYKQGESKRLGVVMNTLLGALHKIAICLWPVMPDASLKMLEQLGCKTADNDSHDLNIIPPVTNLAEEVEKFTFLPQGQHLAPSSNLFPRLDVRQGAEADSPKSARTPAKKDKSSSESANAGVPTSGIEAFHSLDIRTGTITDAQKHPNADRILVFQIDFGSLGNRQILSAIAEHYKPQDLMGQKVCAIINLEPRKIRGLVSNGMILTVESGSTISLLQSSAPNGSKIS